MRRRRGGIRGTAAAAPQAHSFLSWQKRHSAPFSLRGKEKGAGGKKKAAKGELRRNKLHIPHPVRRKRRTGVVRSVVPPFPTRIAALDSRGSLAPFVIPLKRPRKGTAAPSLDFPRSLVCGPHPDQLPPGRVAVFCPQRLAAGRLRLNRRVSGRNRASIAPEPAVRYTEGRKDVRIQNEWRVPQ